MGTKATGIVGYITWIGWLVAFFAGDREGAKFHLNQALVLNLCATVISLLSRIGGIVAWICGILDVVVFVFWILGLIYACKEQEKELPLIGGIQILS